MGESDRYIDYSKQRKSFGSDRNALVALVCINAFVFVAMYFLEILGYIMKQPAGYFENTIQPWFLLPANFTSLTERPWTLLSYMFTDTSLMLTLTNMLWLWAFGSIFQNIAGTRKLIPVYIYGGLAGAAAFIISIYSIPAFQPFLNSAAMKGASSATMAVAIATTALAPDFRLFKMLNGGIPLWILTLLYVVIDFVGVGSGIGAYNIAHLAGGCTGFLFVFSLRKGKDWSIWMINLWDWFINLFNPNKPVVQKNRIREKVFYKTGNQKPFVKTTNITQQRIDEILDKINLKGYHLLTEEEKNILKRAGEDL